MTVMRVGLLRRVRVTEGSTAVVLLTALFVLIAAVTVPRFATTSNIQALLLSVSLTGIAAVGLSLITLVGRIFSLSISSTVALSTIVFAECLPYGAWLALAAAVGFGTFVGWIQGIIVGRFQTDPIITTIAFSAILIGAGELATGGLTISRGGDAGIFSANLFGIFPFQVFAFVAVSIGIAVWHRFSVPGRRMALVGLNEKAALVSGVRAWPSVVLSFTVAGATTGLAGGLLSSQSGQGNLILGGTFGFDAVTAVVVGGIAVKGGRGSPISAAVGALFVGLLGNVLVLVGLTYEVQLVVKGALVLSAVVLTGVASRVRGGRSR
jgi:ribose/xylose/arabinose/galactoside ABC-type transport system permease subunit